MKKFVFATAAIIMAITGPAAAQKETRKSASVELSVVDAEGKRVQLDALSEADRRRVVSLRNNLQQWGNQQPQGVIITLICKTRPLSCTITISF